MEMSKVYTVNIRKCVAQEAKLSDELVGVGWWEVQKGARYAYAYC